MAPSYFENIADSEAMGMDMLEPAASDESTDEESQLKRTESQALTRQKVEHVLQHLSHRRELVKQLLHGLDDGLDLAGIEQKVKVARNVGEDVLEDMVALDSLSNLFPEDRQARKAALADLEVLTDQVDSAKVCLQKHRKVVEAQQEKEQQEEQMAKAETLEATQELEESELAEESEDDLQFPASQDWAKVKLPIRMQSRAMSDGWVAVAELPSGCSSEDLKMELEDGGLTLRISGLRLPTMDDLEALNQEAQRQLRGRRATETQDFLKLGHGLFGRMDEAIRLPTDVNRQGIRASCKNGVLQLTLPRKKQLRHPRAPLSFRGNRVPHLGW